MDLPKEAKRAPSAPVWNQRFPFPSHQRVNCTHNRARWYTPMDTRQSRPQPY